MRTVTYSLKLPVYSFNGGKKNMIVQPKVRGFMCTTAHPEGCKQAVKAQIDYVKEMPKTEGRKCL